MPKKNRTTLRNYFRSGNMPKEDHFQDLIDSSLNLIEEGFDRSPETGMKVTTMGSRDELTSYFRYDDIQNPVWTVQFGDDGDALQWRYQGVGADAAADRPSLSLNKDGAVGIGKSQPRAALDVAGYIRSEGRSGGISRKFKADGRWAPITEPLQGCHGFEVTAGAGGRQGAGKYSMIHAVALKTYHRSGVYGRWRDRYRGIRVTSAFYRNRHNDIKLRWYPCPDNEKKYRLWIRTKCPYGENVYINVHLTRLWDDVDMSGSRTSDNG